MIPSSLPLIYWPFPSTGQLTSLSAARGPEASALAFGAALEAFVDEAGVPKVSLPALQRMGGQTVRVRASSLLPPESMVPAPYLRVVPRKRKGLWAQGLSQRRAAHCRRKQL
jgi:hypothetical protein